MQQGWELHAPPLVPGEAADHSRALQAFSSVEGQVRTSVCSEPEHERCLLAYDRVHVFSRPSACLRIVRSIRNRAQNCKLRQPRPGLMLSSVKYAPPHTHLCAFLDPPARASRQLSLHISRVHGCGSSMFIACAVRVYTLLSALP